MTFVCSINEDDNVQTIVRRGNSCLLVHPIGYDDFEDKSYTLEVAFAPMIGVEGVELIFWLNEYDAETDSDYPYFSGKEVASFIAKSDRVAILLLLGRAVVHLLKSENPGRVFVCTDDTDVPEKTNKKFVFLGQVFESAGYSVNIPDPYHGRRCWWMERKVDGSH